MRLLLQAILYNRKHYPLIILTVFGMIFVTIGNQLEMFGLRVMTSRGVDAFELFSPESGEGKGDSIHLDQVEKRFAEINPTDGTMITQDQAAEYLMTRNEGNLIDRAVDYLDRYVGIFHDMTRMAYFLIILAVIKAGTLFFNRFTARLVAVRVSRDLRLRFFNHIQSLPMSFFQQYNMGSLSSRAVTDAYVIAESINSCIMNYLQLPFAVVTSLVLCLLTSWKLTLFVFIGFPLVVGPIMVIARMVKRVAKQIQKRQENFTSTIIDFLAGIQTVKIFAMEDFSRKKYEEQNEQLMRLEVKNARYDSVSRPIVHLVATIFLSSVLLYGLYIDDMNISQILFFCGLLFVLYEPVKKFAEENSAIQRGVAAAERLNEVLAIEPLIADHPKAMELNRFERSIEFKNVWFRYEDRWILQDVSFEINKGETVAIVGPTGAGKSTIVQLIPRLYDVNQGEILIDGVSIKMLTQKSVRESIAFVPQKPFLFLDSIAENISFGKDYSREEVEDAARRAYADEFIQQLPDKYDTQVAEMGKNLSGGQQQRLAIARALVKRSSILVMDEATSALDTVSENRIKQAIEEMQGAVTQVIIAHRFSTIEKADRILYMEQGRLVAQGTKEELLINCPPFRMMWEMSSLLTSAKI